MEPVFFPLPAPYFCRKTLSAQHTAHRLELLFFLFSWCGGKKNTKHTGWKCWNANVFGLQTWVSFLIKVPSFQENMWSSCWKSLLYICICLEKMESPYHYFCNWIAVFGGFKLMEINLFSRQTDFPELPDLISFPNHVFPPHNQTTLRIMKSENWWFGDPKEPCENRVKTPLVRRFQSLILRAYFLHVFQKPKKNLAKLFHQPGFSWNKGSHFPFSDATFLGEIVPVRSRVNLTRFHYTDWLIGILMSWLITIPL